MPLSRLIQRVPPRAWMLAALAALGAAFAVATQPPPRADGLVDAPTEASARP